MALYLVRHAHAGSRKAWSGEDRVRPLSKRGQCQADALLGVVAEPVAVVLSSPATRCVQTVEGVAQRAGLEVELDEALSEDREVEPARERLEGLLHQHRGAAVVACSHGDLIPKLLAQWAVMGAAIDLGQRTPKGSTWVLDAGEDGHVNAGRIVLPPD